MSFAADTKNEICKKQNENICCLKAECYGLLLFAKTFTTHSITLTTENIETAHRIAQLCAQTIHVIVNIASALSHRKDHLSSHTITIQGDDQCESVFSYFGYSGKEISLRINRANIENDCCECSFLRGAFLTCGTVTDPQKDYHLEFVVPYMNLAKDLVTLLTEIEELNLQPAIINRKGSFVVYIKGSERIADLLTYLGAPNAAMELMQAKMLKEVRNYVNRKTNFETANIDKTASASARQIVAIEKINQTVGLDFLPDELRELAALRMENPEMSLRELGEHLLEPISRSGVNHRLQRILEYAENL